MAKAPAKKPPAKAKVAPVPRIAEAPAKSAAAKAKAAAPIAKKPAPKPKPNLPIKSESSPKPRADRRGTPKGRGVVAQNGGRIGNPPFVANEAQRKIVETHAAVGTPQWLIAEEIGISEDTLQRHFGKELQRGLLRINARIGSLLAQQALKGDRTSQIFWLKTRGGYKSAALVELGGIGGAPIQHAVVPRQDLSKLSRAELRQFEALALKAGADADPGD